MYVDRMRGYSLSLLSKGGAPGLGAIPSAYILVHNVLPDKTLESPDIAFPAVLIRVDLVSGSAPRQQRALIDTSVENQQSFHLVS